MPRTPRRPKTGYYLDPTDRTPKKDKSGRPRCRLCKASVPSPRRSFCSDKCVHDWRLWTDGSYRRHQVGLRDGGTCALCGLDTVDLFNRCWAAYQEALGPPGSWPVDYRSAAWKAIVKAHGMPAGRETFWEADHVVPLAEGGTHDLLNMRTLCSRCHREESRKLRERLKAAKAKPPRTPDEPPCDASA